METVLLMDSQTTQAPLTSVNRDSAIFNEGSEFAMDAPLMGSLGQVLQEIISEVRSRNAKLDLIDGRLKRIEDTLSQMKEGQILSVDANQHFKAQVANEVKKISQHQDIGDNL